MPLVQRSIPDCLTASATNNVANADYKTRGVNYVSTLGTVKQLKQLSEHANQIFDDLSLLVTSTDVRIDYLTNKIDNIASNYDSDKNDGDNYNGDENVQNIHIKTSSCQSNDNNNDENDNCHDNENKNQSFKDINTQLLLPTSRPERLERS